MDRIINNIIDYTEKKPIRFHMPGHGGIAFGSVLDPLLPYDVTELEYTDNLYSPIPGGFMDNALRNLSQLYRTEATVISAGGATLCLQSAIYCAKQAWSLPFAVDYKCHKSVFNSLCLADADVVFFNPDTDLENILRQKPHTVIVTSPDYYGKMLDIKKLCDVCKENSSHLIVDNSHGSHLYYGKDRGLHPLDFSVGLVIDSVHKTLPALTGAALLHSKCEITREQMHGAMSLFGSTSPSYLISSSAEGACSYMSANGKSLLAELSKRIGNFISSISNTDFYRKTYPMYDPYRITLVSRIGTDMRDVEKHLHANGIVPEFADESSLVLIPSVFSSDGDFSELCTALNSFVATEQTDTPKPLRFGKTPFVPEISPNKTLFSKKQTVHTDSCLGRIAGELKYAYPPGIPYIIPGVRIDKDRQAMLKQLGITEITVIKE